MNKTGLASTLLFFSLVWLAACGHAGEGNKEEGKMVALRHAENLQIEEFDGYTDVRIRNPWDTAKTLQRLLLLDSAGQLPSSISGATVIRVPLEKTVVFSSIHSSLLNELGAGKAVAGVCDVPYISDPAILGGLKDGKIVDCGNSMTPNIEKIISLDPDAVLLSPYETGGGHVKIDRAGIPVVECADYMETSPLGQAEWMRFFGRLYGEGERSDSLFAEVERRYESLRGVARKTEGRPSVIFDRIYGGSWSVPGGQSTVGILVEDAGGSNPFGKRYVSGSSTLSPEKVLLEGGDADYWLIRYAGENLSMDGLKKDKPIYGEFKAFKNGNVFGSETTETRIFEDRAFHPYLLLEDMISILHPELEIIPEKRYFVRLKEK